MQIHGAPGVRGHFLAKMHDLQGKTKSVASGVVSKPRFGSDDAASQAMVWGGVAILGAVWLFSVVRAMLREPQKEKGADHPEVREAIALAEEKKMREAEEAKKALDKIKSDGSKS